MTFYELSEELDRLTKTEMRAVLTCFWVMDENAFLRAVKAARS